MDIGINDSSSEMKYVGFCKNITADNLEGPLAGKQLSDLAMAGANGTIHVNIHTEQNPKGGNPWTALGQSTWSS